MEKKRKLREMQDQIHKKDQACGKIHENSVNYAKNDFINKRIK